MGVIIGSKCCPYLPCNLGKLRVVFLAFGVARDHRVRRGCRLSCRDSPSGGDSKKYFHFQIVLDRDLRPRMKLVLSTKYNLTMHHSPSPQTSDEETFQSPFRPVKLFAAPEPEHVPDFAPDLILKDDDGIYLAEEPTESESGWSDSEVEVDPVSSSGPHRSSPVNESDHDERVAHLRQKGYKKLRRTLAKRKDERETKLRKEKHAKMEEVIENMKLKGVTVWDFLEHVFHPKNKKRLLAWQQFFSSKAHVTQLLGWWTSLKNSRAARGYINSWIRTYVQDIVSREARKVTKRKTLQTMGKTINSEFAASFSFPKISSMLSSDAPFASSIITAFATGPKATKHTQKRKYRTNMVYFIVVTSSALACLGEYSHANNLAKRMIGMYMYASGAQRQVISALSTLGLSESYSNLISKNMRRVRIKKNSTSTEPQVEEALKVPTGTLMQLSESMREETRDVAATGLYETVYDNINIIFQNPEEVMGRHDTQENGTHATVIPLFDAKIEDLNLEDLQSAFLNAPALSIADIIHTKDERQTFRNSLIFTILRIIVKQGGEGFSRFQEDLKKGQPQTDDQIATHKSELHPLPAWNIDESSITGNAEVIDAIDKELKLNEVPDAAERVQFLAGDQLSIARLRALETIRAGHESGRNAMFWGVWIPGLFHAKVADVLGTLLTHFGKPDTGSRDPNSLWYENTRLDRLPITTTSLPPFRKCRDLLFVSLSARVLHCLLLISKCGSLEEYLIKFTKWEQLVTHATMIFEQFASSSRVQELRGSGKGDMVLENAILFMRDALISREFTDAVKAGDSGRVVLVLKTWALSYRGNGRTKYAYEMLNLIHHLTKIWPKGIRNIVLKNWLLNPTGHPNSFVEIDLVQEHLNFWVKNAYKAHGSNASWDWLDTLAPTIEVLRSIARNFNETLGADQGTRHAPPDLTNDIATLMESLKEHRVYCLNEGRVLGDDTGGAVKDVILVGLHHLTEGAKTPLTEYNEAIQQLQRRRAILSVADQARIASDATPTRAHPNPQPILLPAQATRASDVNQGLEDTSEEEQKDGEKRTEIEMILDDLVHGVQDQTLLRVGEEDVAFDMDEVVVEVEEDEDESSDDELEESGSW
ncbi:hypothetical protein BDN70DRAFT_948601 [Pholiota conissans]|uniref:DUF6589 domain-containing protein n=1 Tax=Pholiota conissans TaxID=109636 RepID=A0A9P6CRL9_9AGAR|nr:hypothetical protein BDN70DRAFT_948601 [Pholiota conissans]